MSKIRLLIVDDSALIRQMLTQIFNSSDEIEVVGSAADPIIARDKIKKLSPDVLTLDVEMPRMDGLTFLRNLMRLRPMPVVMISTLTEAGAAVTLEALEAGAVDFVAKPKVDVSNSLNEYAEDIIAKVKVAARARVRAVQSRPKVTSSPVTTKSISSSPVKTHFKTTDKIIAIGSSTGGTEAIKDVVRGLPLNTPPVVISQHLPVAFSESFAKHVNEVTEMTVCIAKEGQQILPGNIYIAPGDQHLLVIRNGARYVCKLDNGPPVNRHKPSVEVMFKSVAQNVGANAVGVMLTGMGADGSKTMNEMKAAGSVNIVQDEATSVVWGMPGEAYKLGAADHVVPLGKISAKILQLVK